MELLTDISKLLFTIVILFIIVMICIDCSSSYSITGKANTRRSRILGILGILIFLGLWFGAIF